MGDWKLPPFVVEEQLTKSQGTQDTLDWSAKYLKITEAWKKANGRGTVVGILDTGVDKTHATSGELYKRILDMRDFTGSGSAYCANSEDNHGTFCAGLIAARQEWGQGIGVAFASDLLIGKVLHNGSGSGSVVANGIRWMADQGADIISMSLGSPDPDSQIANAMLYAISKNCLIVAAAGNDGKNDSVNYPARWKRPAKAPQLDSLAVGSINSTGRLSAYSSRGPEVDLAFPGEQVTSLWANGGYARLSGTSFSCPLVAGVLALALSAGVSLKSIGEARKHFAKALKDIGPPGKDDGYGMGVWDTTKWGEFLTSSSELPPSPVPSDPTEGITVFIPGGKVVS